MKTDGKPFQVSTQPPRHPAALPRLPHEHDESDDSQQSGVRAPMRQAYDDIMSGQQDTELRESRGVEAVVKDQLAPAGTADTPGGPDDSGINAARYSPAGYPRPPARRPA